MAGIQVLPFGIAVQNDWFDAPPMDINIPLTADPETGRALGLVARWASCHTGYLGQHKCVRPPREHTFDVFNEQSGGHVYGEDGTIIPCGMITAVGHHAPPLGDRVSPKDIARAVEDVAVQVMAVRAYAVDAGIAVAGIVWPGTDPVLVAKSIAARPSGDWRRPEAKTIVRMDGLELKAIHIVNEPGFPVKVPEGMGRLAASSLLVGYDGEEILDFTEGLVACSCEGVKKEDVTAAAVTADSGPRLAKFDGDRVEIVMPDGNTVSGTFVQDEKRTPLTPSGMLKVLEAEKRMFG